MRKLSRIIEFNLCKTLLKFFTFSFPLICIFLPHQITAQQNFPLDRDAVMPYDKLLNNKNVDYHTAVKPFLGNELSVVNDSSIHYSFYKVRNNDKAILPEKNRINIKPFLSQNNISAGYDVKNKSMLLDLYGTAGVMIRYSNKLAISVNYLAGNSIFPNYVDSAIRSTRVVPGIGSAYRSGTGYSYQDFFGYISYSPNKIFNFQIGKDKHFFGDGYRSMLLSDNAATYSFFKIQTHIWKIKWVNLFTAMKDVTAPSGLQSDFKDKYASMQYLSWNATKRINISLFEAIVWQGNDTNRARGFDINYLNPVAFYRPTEYSLGSADNALIAATIKIKLPLKLQFYGQFLLDEFLLKEMVAHTGWWGNKFSIQAGLKAFDLLGIENLNMLAEFNYVRPYTYTHGSVQQNYGHYNQAIANPFGASFEEFVGILNYRVKRFIFEIKGVAAMTGLDTAGKNLGQNIFLSYITHPYEYGNWVGQGRKTAIGTADFRISYLLVPSLNLKVDFGVRYHTQQSFGLKPIDSAIISFGIRTSFYNTYQDY